MHEIGVGFFVGAGVPKGEKLRCWTCQGNGMTQYPHCDPVTCEDRDGKGYRYKRVNAFAECGCCGAYHRTDFNGDCREDSERHWDLPEDAEVVYSDDDDNDQVRQTACKHCGQDIENLAPFPVGEWRDRGNNTACPTPEGDARQLHEPVSD